METDHRGARFREALHVLLRMDDHQVDVHRLLRFPRDGFHHRETEGDVRDEGPVHDIEVEEVGVCVDRLNVLVEMEEIGGQDGRGYEHLRRN